MELSYVLHAAKRYWKVVIACTVLGAVLGYFQLGSPTYVARATLSVNAGSDTAAGETPDRHVATEIGVLTSQEFAAKVAKKLGHGATARELQADVSVTQQSGTDLVDIVAKHSDGSKARAIASTYADLYAGQVADSGIRRRAEVTRRYDARLAAAREELAGVDASIEATLAGYNATNVSAVRPNIEQIKPDLASHRSVLLDQVTQLTNERARALLSASAVNSAQIIERGTDPRLDGKSKLMVLGPFTLAALLGGVFLSVVFARVSPRVLDGEEAAEIVGAPLFGELPDGFGAGAKIGSAVAIDDAVFLNEMCARLESSPRSGPALTVLVVGSEHVADSSSLATALATNFETRGLATARVDIDARRVDPPQAIPTATPNLRDVMSGAQENAGGRPSASVRSTLVAEAPQIDAAYVREHGPAVVLDRMSTDAEVVIVAAGSLLEAPASAEFADLVDVVVLMVPTGSQTRRRMHIVAQQLAHRTRPVLVVDDRRDHLAVTDRRRAGLVARTQPASDSAGGGRDAARVAERFGGAGVVAARADSRLGTG